MSVPYDYTTKVTALVLEQFEGVAEKPAHVESHVCLQDYGLDWLAHTELIMRLEEEFALIIEDEVAEQLLTVEAIVRFLGEKEAAK